MVPITGNVENELFTCPNDAAIGDAVYVSASETVAYADVSDAAKFAQGVVWHKITATTCKIRFGSGIIHTSGLTPADVYYLTSTATTGNTLATAVSAQRIGIAISATKLLILGFQAYSTDGTLAGDSDIDVPTEKATKTYVDTTAAPAAHSHSDPEIGDDHTHTYTASETIQLNNAAAHTTLTITNTDGTFNANLDVEGNIVVGGTVDGVDIAARDHAKYVLTEDLASGEISQLQNINATTITTGQWGYVGGADQAVKQADSPTFVGLTLSGAIATPTNITFSGSLITTGQTITQTELDELATINATTITAGQWGYVGGADQAVKQADSPTFVGLTLSGAIATPTNISMTGELDLTGVNALIDLNPAGTGSSDVISIIPTAGLNAGSTWKGIFIDGTALDPATGAFCRTYGVEVDFSGVNSTDDDEISRGFMYTSSADGDVDSGFHYTPTLQTVAGQFHHGFHYAGGSLALAVSATNRGLWIDMDTMTRNANAPILEGIRAELPADYSNFGTSFVAYLSGDSRAVTICDTSWALDVTGAVRLNTTLELATGSTTVSEFSTDGTMAGDSDAAVPTEKATKAYIDAANMIGSANAAWIPCMYGGVSVAGWGDVIRNNLGIRNATTTNLNHLWQLPIPTTNGGGLKLYINDIRCSLNSGDGANYIDNTSVWGQKVQTSIFDDARNLSTICETIYGGWGAATDCSSYEEIYVWVAIVVGTIQNLDINGFALQCYYDT